MLNLELHENLYAKASSLYRQSSLKDFDSFDEETLRNELIHDLIPCIFPYHYAIMYKELQHDYVTQCDSLPIKNYYDIANIVATDALKYKPIIIEVKAPHVKIKQDITKPISSLLNQLNKYFIPFNDALVVVTNGRDFIVQNKSNSNMTPYEIFTLFTQNPSSIDKVTFKNLLDCIDMYINDAFLCYINPLNLLNTKIVINTDDSVYSKGSHAFYYKATNKLI